jgi:DNA polymerase III sliding clamp (beta) subunit (PCNA family)
VPLKLTVERATLLEALATTVRLAASVKETIPILSHVV